MIDNIFGNKTNLLILRFLIKFDNQFLSIDNIVKETGAGLRNIRASLKILLYEGILTTKVVSGKTYYKFVVNSKCKDILYSLFGEEKKRLFLKSNQIYKCISEVESKIIKIMGGNLIDIFLFGSVAKGRDVPESDIDLCILVDKHDIQKEKRIISLSFDTKFSNEIQFIFFTSKELIDAANKKNDLAMNILKDGVSLKIGV